MKRLVFAAVVALAVGGGSNAALAADHSYTFSGTTNEGAFSGTATLDVVNGFAISGSGTISGDDIGSNQAFSLVTAATPGAFMSANGFGYENTDGDEPFDLDDAVPISSAGILFATGTPDANGVGSLLFGASENGDGSYTNFFLGNSATAFRFYEQSGDFKIAETGVSGAPEPAAWALMLGGVGILGGVLRFVQARRREDEPLGMASA